MPHPTSLILLILTLIPDANRTVAAEPMTCGYRTITVNVPQRTPVTTAIWYPAQASESTFVYGTTNGGQIVGSVAAQAPALAGSWPVIIFSHGFSGGGVGQIELTEAFARSGYVVAAPDHWDAVMSARIGTTATGSLSEALDYLTAHPIDPVTYGYRIDEITAVAEAMRQYSDLYVDMRHLVLAGHSMGGWTVVSAQLAGLEPTALVSFSMGELNWLYNRQRYFEAPVFQAMTFPTLYLYGSKEYEAALASARGGVYAAFAHQNSPPPSTLAQIIAGNHFVYNTAAVGGVSAGTSQQMAFISTTTVQFLDQHLNIPPVNLTLPGVVGSNLGGQTLTANPGGWSDVETPAEGLAFAYRWWQADDILGSNAVPISGATGGTYVVQAGDLGKALRVVVSVTDGGYRQASGATTSAASPWLGSGISAAVPTVTSPLSAFGTVGNPFNYQIAASNGPVVYGVSDLIPGLAVDPTTGLITGIPTTAGVSNLTLSVSNAAGTGTATLVLTVHGAGGDSNGGSVSSAGGGGCGAGSGVSLLAGMLAMVGLRRSRSGFV